jgi:hypothetical protein
MPRNAVLALSIVIASLPGAARASAQEHAQHARLGRLGRVSFPVSCTAEARRRFEQAMAGLHSFWWEEGDRAFGAVLAADSSCAMAQWGRALNAWGNPFAGGPLGPSLALGVEAAAKASAKPLPTAREQGFVNAVAALYRNASATSNAERLQAYADTLARLYREFPDDVEVTIYHALALVATAPRTDTTFAQQKRAIALLNPLYDRYPDHPGLAHYIIHSTDSPRLASLGLKAARRYTRIAPAAPHAQHMPSHIFVRLGLWDETVSANLQAFQVGMDHMRATAAPGPSPEELHVLDYAVYGYLQRGRDSAAKAAVARGESLGVVVSRNALVAEYNRTAMAARVPLETGDWASAASFPAPQGRDSGVSVVLRRFTRAIGAARSGDAAAARVEVAGLDGMSPRGDLLGADRRHQARRGGGVEALRFRRQRGWAGAGGGRGGQRGRDRQASGHPGRAASRARAAGRYAPRRRAVRRSARRLSGDARERAGAGPRLLRGRSSRAALRQPGSGHEGLRRLPEGDAGRRRQTPRDLHGTGVP